MLRVRPIVATSHAAEDRQVLEALGMVVTEEGDGWVALDAGSGRVVVRDATQRPSTGRTEGGRTTPGGSAHVTFGVEIRDPEEFVRRTLADGGDATRVARGRGTRVRIVGPDGFSFFADPSVHEAAVPEADTRLTVRAVWLTPNVPGAAATLAAIGARPRPAPVAEARGAVEFTAKNGGVLVAAPSEAPASGGLAFEYDGDLTALADRLTSAGASFSATATGLGVVTPGGGTLTVMTAHGHML